MSLIRQIRYDIAALALLKDWLGDDLRHVSQEQADHRSMACLRGNGGEECPHHKAARWWETAKVAGAEVIRGQLELKHKFRMATPFDDSMKMCRICGCSTGLKIWTPIDHIRAYTAPEMLPQFPPFCWQRQELEAT